MSDWEFPPGEGITDIKVLSEKEVGMCEKPKVGREEEVGMCGKPKEGDPG